LEGLTRQKDIFKKKGRELEQKRVDHKKEGRTGVS